MGSCKWTFAFLHPIQWLPFQAAVHSRSVKKGRGKVIFSSTLFNLTCFLLLNTEHTQINSYRGYSQFFPGLQAIFCKGAREIWYLATRAWWYGTHAWLPISLLAVTAHYISSMYNTVLRGHALFSRDCGRCWTKASDCCRHSSSWRVISWGMLL